MNSIKVKIAGKVIETPILFRDTALFFSQYLTDEDADISVAGIDKNYYNTVRINYPETTLNGYIEFSELQFIISKALNKYRICAFHGVSFRFHDKAWIFTAPSGTGKTTQYNLWKKLYGDEIGIINGDKCFLSFENDIEVYSSPWMGKENFGINTHAPLGGMIILEQSADNLIRILDTREAVIPVFSQFISFFESREEIKTIASFSEKILKEYPLWLLQNNAADISAEITRDAIEKYLEKF